MAVTPQQADRRGLRRRGLAQLETQFDSGARLVDRVATRPVRTVWEGCFLFDPRARYLPGIEAAACARQLETIDIESLCAIAADDDGARALAIIDKVMNAVNYSRIVPLGVIGDDSAWSAFAQPRSGRACFATVSSYITSSRTSSCRSSGGSCCRTATRSPRVLSRISSRKGRRRSIRSSATRPYVRLQEPHHADANNTRSPLTVAQGAGSSEESRRPAYFHVVRSH